MRKGFTLIEMLVVIGIIMILIGASLAGYKGMIASAQKTRANELVHDAVTALVQVMQVEDAWPRPILAEGASGKGKMTSEVGAALARHGAMTLTYRKVSENGTDRYELSGLDKFGVVDPWGAAVVKSLIKKSSLSLATKVPTGGTLEDHLLRFAIDDDYDGRVTVSGDGVSATIRASAVVWGAGRDGVFGTRDDLRSWSRDQEER